MAVKDEQSSPNHKADFPVDNRPLIGSFILLILVFIGLCLTVYFQNESDSGGAGNILLGLAFCFAAYLQRGDTFRVVGILVGGLVVSIIVFIASGSSDAPDISEQSPRKTQSHTMPSPEGLGQ